MPNRYEREIEEILRNLEGTGAKPGPGERPRKKPGGPPKPRGRSFPSFQLKPIEWLIIVAVLAGVLAGGYAYIFGPNVITGIIAIAGFICLLIIIISPFINRAPPRRGGNVSHLRFNPFRRIATRWNLFLLKRRLRKKNDLER